MPGARDDEALYGELDRQYDFFSQVDRTFALVSRTVAPSVVHIVARKPGFRAGRGSRETRFVEETGSGVIVRPDGEAGLCVLTNHHVVMGAETSDIGITLLDGRVLQPIKVWTDAKADIAVLELGRDDLPAARLGDSDDARVGTWVLALGSPFGLTHSVSHGIISARNRHEEELEEEGVENQEFLQTDAAINPGNSGGPLVNMRGEVIGINTAIASSGGGSEGVGFSIPINLAKWILNELISHGRVNRGLWACGFRTSTPSAPSTSGSTVLGCAHPLGAGTLASLRRRHSQRRCGPPVQRHRGPRHQPPHQPGVHDPDRSDGGRGALARPADAQCPCDGRQPRLVAYAGAGFHNNSRHQHRAVSAATTSDGAGPRSTDPDDLAGRNEAVSAGTSPLVGALACLVDGDGLTAEQARAAVATLMEGEAPEAVIAAFLTALRVRGETAEVLTGAVQAVRERMTVLPGEFPPLLDTCGTGGDGACTLNVSTATALVVASCGVPVAKHGNRSASGNSGSAEVLAELGVAVEAELPIVARCLSELGITFLFAPRFHPALRHAAPVRRRLPFRTLFNLVGPMANPARPDYQLVGVPTPQLADLIAATLARLHVRRAAVVTGPDGLDEVSLAGPTRVLRVDAGRVSTETWAPDDFGLPIVHAADLRVDGPTDSASRLRAVFAGEPGPPAMSSWPTRRPRCGSPVAWRICLPEWRWEGGDRLGGRRPVTGSLGRAQSFGDVTRSIQSSS